MIKIDSVNHLETLMSTENFSIGDIFGPKTACEVERFSKTSKILQILRKGQVFDGTFDGVARSTPGEWRAAPWARANKNV